MSSTLTGSNIVIQTARGTLYLKTCQATMAAGYSWVDATLTVPTGKRWIITQMSVVSQAVAGVTHCDKLKMGIDDGSGNIVWLCFEQDTTNHLDGIPQSQQIPFLLILGQNYILHFQGYSASAGTGYINGAALIYEYTDTSQ
jgi:hypothetical protein